MTSAGVVSEPDWYRALSLRERLSAAASAGEIVFDRELAAGRLERWRSQAPFSEDGFFARRLAEDGLDEESLLPLLGESAEDLRARLGETEPTAWLRAIETAYATPLPAEPLPWPQRSEKHPTGFLNLVEPLARRISAAPCMPSW